MTNNSEGPDFTFQALADGSHETKQRWFGSGEPQMGKNGTLETLAKVMED
jgi:hypothetical protein